VEDVQPFTVIVIGLVFLARARANSNASREASLARARSAAEVHDVTLDVDVTWRAPDERASAGASGA
jgi:hypothetical protein